MAVTTSPQKSPRGGNPRELALVNNLSSMIHRSLDLSSILSFALEEAMQLMEMEAGAARLGVSSDSPRPIALYRGFSPEATALLEEAQQEGSPIQQKLAADQPIIWSGISSSTERSVAEILQKDGLQILALYPISTGNRRLGTLAFASRSASPNVAIREETLRALTDILGVAIVNAELREQAQKLSEDLVALQEVNKIISRSFDLEGIIQRIVVEGKRLVKTSQCHLFLLDPAGARLLGSASTQTENLDIRKVEIKVSELSMPITALREKRVIAVEDALRSSLPDAKLMETLNWRAAIFAPLLTKDQPIGLLVCSDESRERSYTQQEILRAETLAHQAAIALENARLFQVVSRSQKEWETTFDAMQDCVSVHDTTGKVVRANVALARRLKTTPPKVIGKYCPELYGNGAEPSHACQHIPSLESEALIVEEVEIPAMGGVFQISVSPWYDKNNRLTGSIHVAKDVSNEKLLQQQLIQSEKLSAIGELISGIAHELNNPLTGVMGYSQLLQLRKDIDDRAKDSLLKINNLALRCQKIVQNLLSFARKQKPERVLCDINEVLGKTIELRNYELQVNNIELISELSRDLPGTIADAHQLQQVFLNVITNAEQAMLEAHGRGKLIIRTRRGGSPERIIVEISDDGPGIPETHLTKIFDPFFTTKEVGHGTGLGLSLSYGIIKEHGGNIYARSRIEGGATFEIEIPVIKRLQEESILAPELEPQGFQFENLVRGKRVLVVDDEKYILEFFVEVFRMFPMQVDTASDGRAALEKIKQNSYDVIITDFRMPQMSGKELFNWIRVHRPPLANRVIFVTGDTVSEDTRTFFEDNSTHYLAKPFKIEEIKEVIQQVIEHDSM
jgi:two-component system, NtrC family, sensor kinase